MKAFVLACFVVLSGTVLANADVRPPVKPAEQKVSEPKYILHTGLEITTDPKAYEAKLQIPQSQLQSFRAALDGAPSNPAVVGSIALSGPRTIIAGLLMFLAISVAGVLLARSSSFGRTQKALAAIVIAAVVLGVPLLAMIVFGTMAASTTRTHLPRGSAANHSAASRISWSESSFAMPFMRA